MCPLREQWSTQVKVLKGPGSPLGLSFQELQKKKKFGCWEVSCCWLSVLTDRLGLCKSLLITHVFSKNASDFNNLYAQLCLAIRWQIGGSPQKVLKGHNLSYHALLSITSVGWLSPSLLVSRCVLGYVWIEKGLYQGLAKGRNLPPLLKAGIHAAWCKWGPDLLCCLCQSLVGQPLHP